MSYENAIIIVNKTRLENLIERFNTKPQARFYIESLGGSFTEYEIEHNNFKITLNTVLEKTTKLLNCKVVDRQYLPNFIFSKNDLIIVIGQDGLVANTAKYAKGTPIIAINPDIDRFDGILLPFDINNFDIGLKNTIENKATLKKVTMGKVVLQDGQSLLAFNDFFIGPQTHVSARYKLTYNGKSERHSSSGIIISTGAGSTGWLSSLFNMANSIYASFGNKKTQNIDLKFDWDSHNLAFIVREPFKSIYTGTELTAGIISNKMRLKIESYMPNSGKIFSDGIEDDFLSFNSGAIAEIGLADENANIVIG